MECAVCWCLLGSSPHPSMTEEEDSQSELLIAEEKMSPEQEGQLMSRYRVSSPDIAMRQICLCSAAAGSFLSALAILWHLLEDVKHQIQLVLGEKSRLCSFVCNVYHKQERVLISGHSDV